MVLTTVVLSGLPKYVPLVELAICIDKFLNTDEVGTFMARELPNHSRTNKRLVALDFKDSFHAMEAQNILNKYQYKLPGDDKEYTLSAKVTNDLALMASPDYGNELVPYNSRASTSRHYYEDQLQELRRRLMVVETENELIRAEKKLERFKRKIRERQSDSESDSDSGAKRKKKKKKKRSRRSASSSSMSPPTPTRLAIEGKTRYLDSDSGSKHKKKKNKKRSRRSSSSSMSPTPTHLVIEGKSRRRASRKHSSSRSASPPVSRRRVLSSPKDAKRSWSKESLNTAVVAYSKSSSDKESERKISPKRYLNTPPPLPRTRWDTFEKVNVLRKPPCVETPEKELKKSKWEREKSVEKEKSKKKPKRDKSSDKRSKRDKSSDNRSIRDKSSDKRPKREKSSDKRFKRDKSSDKRSKRDKSSNKRPKRDKSSNKRPKREKSSDKRFKRDKSSDKRSKRDSVERRSRWSYSSNSDGSRFKSPRKGRKSYRSAHKRRAPTCSRSRYDSGERSVSRSKPDSSRYLSPARHDSPKSSYRMSPSRRSSPSGRSSPSPSPYRKSRARSPSYRKARPRSPSYRKARPRSPPRYKQEPDYRAYYRDDYEDAYRGMSARWRAEDSQVIYVPRDKQRYSSPPPATVTEITEGDEGEVLSDVVDNILEGVDSLVEEEKETSPSRINLVVNVVKRKQDKDPEQELDEDISHSKRIKTENDKVKSDGKKSKKMPQPMHLDSSGYVKKEKMSDRDKRRENYDDDIRRAMPRPIKKEDKASDIINIEPEEEIPTPPKRISKNPRFVMAVSKIIKKMNCHIKDIPEDLKYKFLGLMRKILRLRIKDLLEGKTEYVPTAGIIALYRETYFEDDDAGLVQKLLDDIKEGLFDDFVPSDDEDETTVKTKKVPEDPKLFEPYVAGMKKKIVRNKMDNENKENIVAKYTSNSKDDDVIVLEKPVDVIDITDVEEGKIKKETDSEPPADVDSDVICIDCDEDTVPKVKREIENTTENMDNVNISVKTEESGSNVPQVSLEETTQTNAINVKTEVSKDIEDESLLADAPSIKTEIVEVVPTIASVKTENSIDGSVGLNNNEDGIVTENSLSDITSAIDEIITSVKPEPFELECESEEIIESDKSHENNKTVHEKPVQEVQVNKEDLINDILKISDQKMRTSNPSLSSNDKDIDPGTDAAQINTGSEKEQTDTDKIVKKEVSVPEESLESIENYVNLLTNVIDID